MNFRNNKSTFKGNALSVDGKFYVLVRSDVFYFLQFINYEKEILKTTSSLSSTPNVIFYNENSTEKVILDYTNSTSNDIAFLNNFFAGLPVNSGFTLTNGSYLNEPKNIEADLSSNLKFKEFKNNLVFAEVNSVTSKSTATDVYNAIFFLQPPQLFSGISLGSSPYTKANALINKSTNDKNLFINLGLQSGDILEIVNENSSNNRVKFKIQKIDIFNGQEILYLNNSAISESLLGKPVLVNLYTEGKPEPQEKINIENINLGCCFVGTDIEFSGFKNVINVTPALGSTYTDILRNTTESQCKVITQSNDRFFKDCFFGTTLIQPVVQFTSILSVSDIQNSQYYGTPQNNLSLKIQNNKIVFNPPFSTLTENLYFKFENDTLFLKRDSIHKIDQQDISNLSKKIIFTLDLEKTMNYDKNIWGRYTLDGYDSLIFIRILPDTPVLYMSVEGDDIISPVKIVTLP